ncbi:ATP-dependent DNA helicase PIF1 [Phanerochaete sordida]|uniref:ATP-dependent DNA helicase PIF1 n=1 Tax=Phanerochaete sordida TaxID=48140 RepID=A0A9P3GEL8_9APHY|nr:ATP-dependent DNA helicase PIF1 [Phanerochaete sordida]
MPSATTTKKRKSTGTADERAAKQPRQTLEAFFTPKVVVACAPKDEPEKVTRERVALNAEQNKVLRMVVDEGKNVFFTGSAGTGKSLLLRAIISALRKKHAKKADAVSVTASTGIASLNIGGTTIHAWGAITPGMHDIDKLISYIKTCKPAHKRWKATQVLIIDEVSMVDGQLFDTLAKLAVELRKKTNRPFGGIQLVVTGDFFQLPPVTRGGKEPFFAFQSTAWKQCIEHTVTLTQVFRQKDTTFVDLLNEMRRGEISPEARKTFVGLSRPLPQDDGLQPTELFPLRMEVDRANAARMAALTGPPCTYEARDSGAAPAEKRAKLLDAMVATRVLQLKADAQVMLVKNVDESLVNGSVGRVLGFFATSACVASVAAPVLPEASPTKPGGSKPASSAKPKSQQDVSKAPNGFVRNVQVGPDGRTPVALCPETVKENTTPPPSPSKAKARAKDEELLPLVEFSTPQGKEIVLIARDEFRSEDSEGKLLARRVQIPLVLAWAMSIHKSQGQTIQKVKVDLGRVFEKGQSYVALSRAATMEGLQVLRFDAKKVMAHPKVIEWAKTLEQTSTASA